MAKQGHRDGSHSWARGKPTYSVYTPSLPILQLPAPQIQLAEIERLTSDYDIVIIYHYYSCKAPLGEKIFEFLFLKWRTLV